MSTDIRTKYLKYKTKYLELKKQMSGNGKGKEIVDSPPTTISELKDLVNKTKEEKEAIIKLNFDDNFDEELIYNVNEKNESIFEDLINLKELVFGNKFNKPLIYEINGKYISVFKKLNNLEVLIFGNNFDQKLIMNDDIFVLKDLTMLKTLKFNNNNFKQLLMITKKDIDKITKSYGQHTPIQYFKLFIEKHKHDIELLCKKLKYLNVIKIGNLYYKDSNEENWLSKFEKQF
jgi:hypothetical protein